MSGMEPALSSSGPSSVGLCWQGTAGVPGAEAAVLQGGSRVRRTCIHCHQPRILGQQRKPAGHVLPRHACGAAAWDAMA